MKRLIILIPVFVVIAIIVIAVNHKSVKCEWIAPLKTNYQECSNGTVRER